MINACELCEMIENENKLARAIAERQKEEQFIDFCENKLNDIIKNHRRGNTLDGHYYVDENGIFCSSWGGWLTKYYHIDKINNYLKPFGFHFKVWYSTIDIILDCPKKVK